MSTKLRFIDKKRNSKSKKMERDSFNWQLPFSEVMDENTE